MSLTFRGTSLQRSGYNVWFDIRHGLKETAEVRGKDTVIPWAAGELPHNRVKTGRWIELYGWIKGTSQDNFYTLLIELQTLFDPILAAGTLQGSMGGSSKTATILARGVSMIPEEDEDLGNTQHFSVLLYSNVAEWTIT